VLSVPSGALIYLSGRNGAGKTSLLAAMLLSARKHGIQAGMARQDVELQVFSPTPRAEIRDVALSWQPPAWLRSILPAEADSLESALASFVDLGPWLDAPMRSLPLGALALLGSAIALLMGRDFVLLDEPTQGLDERAAHRLAAALLQSARAGARIVAASHDPLLGTIASERWCVDGGMLVSLRDSQPYREAS
jgi:ABC-type multidrug transport system ATPase subunit